MSAVQIFRFESAQLRVLLRDGEPRFIATDALALLEVDRTALRRLDEDEKGVDSIHTLGGLQTVTVVTESGLYALILGSRKPEAKAFKRWITHEVLPAIRKTGGYGQPSLPDFTQASPEVLGFIQKLTAATQLAVESAQKNAAKAEAFDHWLNGKGCYKVGTVAKMIGVGPQTLWDFLYDEKILIRSGSRRREPYAKPQLAGWFEVKPYDQANTNGHASVRTGVTPYGAERIRLLAISRGLIEPQLLAITGGAS